MINWSEEDLKNYYKKTGSNKYVVKKQNKYKNKKITFNGMEFDSKKELHRYIELKNMLKNGNVEKLERQVEFVLLDSFKDNNGKTERSVKYIADFMYTINGIVYVEDVKSKITKKDSTYIIKRKLFKKNFPNYIFIEND
ncbi:DUF1064 domain-containing protein [Peptostreptococcus sp. D1]|uniref:DUF1064 domain-containing protein n=1 Tax=Peptostreptococcus sp. D1 TaxID=72304 RepID=UPI0008F4110D|nr:DUF1064 domain-containing protein [Peptostreptococcus sp. D1]SFE90105.1 Protein of unknown function [Peptostreptococcus sp. D1]